MPTQRPAVLQDLAARRMTAQTARGGHAGRRTARVVHGLVATAITSCTTASHAPQRGFFPVQQVQNTNVRRVELGVRFTQGDCDGGRSCCRRRRRRRHESREEGPPPQGGSGHQE